MVGKPDSLGFTRKTATLQPSTKPGTPPRLPILVIGDSWFAYPKEWFFIDFLVRRSQQCTDQLKRLDNPASMILSLSNSGEFVANMAGIASQNYLDVVESVQTQVH